MLKGRKHEERILDDNNVIGSNIKRLRISQNIGQTDLVRLVQLEGVDLIREALVKIEGGRQNINLVQLKAIKKILNASWEDLLD